MSHITTGVEYALHCLLYLADPKAGADAASVRDLADLQGVPVEYVAKLFTRLQKAGLVEATEGVKGGFSLARPAATITVHDVVVAVDGDKRLFDCREIRGRCAVFGERPPAWAMKGVCSIHAVMLEAEDRMREALAAHTLADIGARVASKAPTGFGDDITRWLADRSAARDVKSNR